MKNPRSGILFVGNFPPPEEAAVRHVCGELAEQMRSRGWHVVTTSSAVGRLPRLVDMVSTIARCCGEYRLAHIDVYSGRAFVLAEIAFSLLRALRRPLVLTLHGGALPAFAARHPGRLRRLCRGSAAVTAPSRYLAQSLESETGPVRIIPNGLVLGDFPFRRRRAARRRLVWLRAYHDIYDPRLAVDVTELLIRQNPASRLFMAGALRDERLRRDLLAVVRERGLADRIEVRGPLRKSEVVDHLQQGDVFLNTSQVDNTPVSVMEAMACGLCVVSTDAGGMPFLLRDGADGRLVRDRNPRSYSDVIECLLDDPGQVEILSRNARRAAEGFDWSVIYPLWESLFKEVAGCRAEPGTGRP